MFDSSGTVITSGVGAKYEWTVEIYKFRSEA